MTTVRESIGTSGAINATAQVTTTPMVEPSDLDVAMVTTSDKSALEQLALTDSAALPLSSSLQTAASTDVAHESLMDRLDSVIHGVNED